MKLDALRVTLRYLRCNLHVVCLIFDVLFSSILDFFSASEANSRETPKLYYIKGNMVCLILVSLRF